MKSFKVFVFFFFYLYVCRGARWMQCFWKVPQVPRTTQSLWCALSIAARGWCSPGGCEWPSLCLPSEQCQVEHCLACTFTDWNWEGANQQWCWGRGCLICHSLVGCMNFWHKYLRSKWLKKYIKNLWRYGIINAFCFLEALMLIMNLHRP